MLVQVWCREDISWEMCCPVHSQAINICLFLILHLDV